MPHKLDLRKVLRENGAATLGEATLDLAHRDFMGFAVPQPVHFAWQARAQGDAVQLAVMLEGAYEAECVRCLEPFAAPLAIKRDYTLRPEDLQGSYPEFPATADGALDLEELAYSEVVLEVSPITLCREDCEGLCPGCGTPKARCGCQPTAPQPEDDPRWQALRALLETEDGEPGDAPKNQG